MDVSGGAAGTGIRWPEGWPAVQLTALCAAALAEDIGSGDVTTEACLPPGARARAVLLGKERGVVAGLPVAAACFALADPGAVWRPLASDGHTMHDVPARLAEVEGSARGLLAAERVALNFVQRLSGIATRTAEAVRIAAGRADVLDTRKTTPGLRWLERYAVRTGGGRNHRFGLADGILIKDNHARAAGGVGAAVRAARRAGPRGLRVEVECESLAQVDEALAAGAEIILLDNMTVPELRAAVQRIAGRARTEASGGITLANLADVVATGVDAASLGSLTHSAPALDVSLEVEVGADAPSH